MSPDAKKMTNNEYLSTGGTKCPFCDSNNISADGYPDPDGREAVAKVHCNACKKRWCEIWTLSSWFPNG